jgi:hypothetical protein
MHVPAHSLCALELNVQEPQAFQEYGVIASTRCAGRERPPHAFFAEHASPALAVALSLLGV